MDNELRARVRAVTFDYGQTLAELDHDFMALRVRDLGGELDARAARDASIAAWDAYGAAKSLGHARAWHRMMLVFLRAGAVRRAARAQEPEYADKIASLLW